ncbi:hypothetical protein [Ectobacillus panaciterrae]|uniref:hypothetical protein n=1 Tax=Ectobacillus panaciterrae TaxID=363872 RepID=UPI00041BE2FB
MKESFHCHIGVYGICTKENSLLVIAKGKGPYANRYNLPGGSEHSFPFVLRGKR